MISRVVRWTMIVALATLAAASPATVAAAATTVKTVEVRLVNDSQGAVILVSSTVSTDKLPAEIQLAVPKGAQILWAGEILGGDPSKDPKAEYDLKSLDGFDLITMTIKQSRTGQVEYRDAQAVKDSGKDKTATISWVSPVDAPSATLSIEVPAGANVSDAGGAKLDSTTGNFYRKPIKGVKAGDKLELKVTYSGGSPGGSVAPPAATPAPQTTPPNQGQAPTGGGGPASPTTLVLVALVLVGGTLLALRWMNSRQR